MNKWLCLILCGCIVAGTLAFGEEDMKNTSKNSIPQLSSLKTKECMKLLEQISKERSNLQSGLISQLDQSNPKEVNFTIAYLLGVYRMEQSVQNLSKFITLEEKRNRIWDREPLWDRYPFVEALIRIGNPAVPEMIKNIETSRDKKVRELSAKVIRYVMGPEIAKVVLEKAMQGKSGSAKVNLKAAIESIHKSQASELKPGPDQQTDRVRHGIPETRPVNRGR